MGHYQFNYNFSDAEGITFRGITDIIGDLFIYYDTLIGENFIDCRCSRWDVNNYSVTIETWLKKDDLTTLVNNLVPGAVGELYKILGETTYHDKTWEGNNTIKLKPNYYNRRIGPDGWEGDNLSSLFDMRNETIIYPKNISTHPINYTGWIEVKIEGYISGGQDL